MLNRTLHLVSNRRDFVSPFFFSDPDFKPASTPQADAVRKLLGLDVVDTDYHVRAVVFAVHGQPWINVNDPAVTYKPTDFTRDPVESIGASWIFDDHGAPFFNPVPVSAPIPAALRLEAITTSRARIVYGDIVEDVATRWLPDSKQLYPEWPASLGVSGGLKLDFEWGPEKWIQINGYPTRYPWAVVAAELDKSEHCHALLLTAGLMEHFKLADTALEKVAVTALALITTHPAYNG
jgi:hypothetical protein